MTGKLLEYHLKPSRTTSGTRTTVLRTTGLEATDSFWRLLTSIVGSRLPSLVKILLLLRSSNASPRYSVFLVFRLMFIVTEGQLSSVEN